jgi:AraC-like DNA-binding protein
MVESSISSFLNGQSVCMASEHTVAKLGVLPGWPEEIAAERWSLPPHLVWPEHIMARHRLVVHLGSRPVPSEWSEDGRIRKDSIPPGAVALVPQHSVSSGCCSSKFEVATLEFSSGVLDRFLDGHAPSSGGTLTLNRNVYDGVVYDVTRRIATEMMAPTERLYGEMLCLCLGVRVLLRFGRAPVGAVKFRGRLSSIEARRVLDYMHVNLDGSLSVAALAQVAGLSEAYFARAFRATFNEPPHRLVLRWRLERAVRLLRTRDASLAEAAVAAGFCDQAHLTNAMRRHFGETPGRLLRQWAQM